MYCCDSNYTLESDDGGCGDVPEETITMLQHCIADTCIVVNETNPNPSLLTARMRLGSDECPGNKYD